MSQNSKSSKSSKALKQLERLAYGKCNDAVKLILADVPVNWEIIDSLDLSLLSELKRGSNGVIEIRLINRLHALELIAKLSSDSSADNSSTPHAESFYKALDEAADRSS